LRTESKFIIWQAFQTKSLILASVPRVHFEISNFFEKFDFGKRSNPKCDFGKRCKTKNKKVQFFRVGKRVEQFC